MGKMYIQWSHLLDLYETNRPNGTSPGLTLIPKLKNEHVHLTSYSKMRVDLATQVGVNHVESMLLLTYVWIEKIFLLYRF